MVVNNRGDYRMTKEPKAVSIPAFCLLCLIWACSSPPGTPALDTSLPDATAETIDVSECPDGLVSWPEGMCAPAFLECENPWELPLVGGGCMAIGPRACPRAWDAEAEIDCDPGELLPCPEGFGESGDGVYCAPRLDVDCGLNEVPVLGGGCKKTGPEWEQSGEHGEYFDDCPPGRLALAGGGCAAVGPRACPRLWNPEAEVDCEVGDILPCPEGWEKSEDGLYCRPVYDECGFGELAVPGGGCKRVVPPEEDCPAGPFPDVPEGAVDVVYADAASNCELNCGSQDSPYPSIQMAVDSVADGGYVLIGAGAYDEGVALLKEVHLVGLCAANTRIVGTTEVPGRADVEPCGIAIADSVGVEVSGLGVLSLGFGITAANSTGWTLSDVEVGGSEGVAFLAVGASEGIVRRAWVHDVAPMPGFAAAGLLVIDGSKVTVEGSLFETVEGIGLHATTADTSLDVWETTVRASGFPEAASARGVTIDTDSIASLHDVLVEQNEGTGFLVGLGAAATLERCVVRDSYAWGGNVSGIGIQASGGAKLAISDSRIAGNTEFGLFMSDAGTEVSLEGTVIAGTLCTVSGDYGYGVVVTDEAVLTASGSVIESNRGVGVSVRHPASTALMRGTLIRSTEPDLAGHPARGLEVVDFAEANLNRCLIEGNSDLGIGVLFMGAVLELADSVVRDTQATGNQPYSGIGIVVQEKASVTLSNSLLDRNIGCGLSVKDGGAMAIADHCVVRNTQPDADGLFGRGIDVSEGKLTLSNSLVAGNTEFGVAVSGSGSEATVDASRIAGTIPNAQGKQGHGIQAALLAQMTVRDSIVEKSAGIGVKVMHAGTNMAVERSIIRDTKLNATGEFGIGLQAIGACFVDVLGSVVVGNHAAGIDVRHSGTRAVIRESLVADTAPDQIGWVGYGLEATEESRVEVRDSVVRANSLLGVFVSEGAELSMSRCLLDDNIGMGLYLADAGTLGMLDGCVIRSTKPNEYGDAHAIQIGEGAHFAMFRCLLDSNVGAGVVVSMLDTVAEIRGSIIRDTKATDYDQYGVGIGAQWGAMVEVSHSLVSGNSTLGIGAFDVETFVSLDGCVILETAGGGTHLTLEAQIFGDGVFAGAGARLDVSRSAMLDNERCGAYYYESFGDLDGNIITGNWSFGLAMEKSEEKVTHAGGGNFIFGNAKDLPPTQAADTTTSSEGMPVPAKPEIFD